VKLPSNYAIGNTGIAIGTLMAAGVLFERVYAAWGWRPLMWFGGIFLIVAGYIFSTTERAESQPDPHVLDVGQK
jgi:MFS family permease